MVSNTTKVKKFSSEEIIRHFSLRPHPEGGHYHESYRSVGTLSPVSSSQAPFPQGRSYSTHIYYLLEKGDSSWWHRLQSDEMWHFYLGDPLLLVQLGPQDGRMEKVILGPDPFSGQQLFHVVPAGCWFAARPLPQSEYSFLGCTVSPGFDFRDYELAQKEELISQFPLAQNVIEQWVKEKN